MRAQPSAVDRPASLDLDLATAGRQASAKAPQLLVAGALALLLTAPIGSSLAQESPRLYPNEAVTLVDSGRGGNEHPKRVEPEELRAALAALRMELDRGGVFSPGPKGPQRVFTDQSLRRGVPKIVEALAGARPDQDVAIKLSQSGRSSGALGGEAVTAARLFYRNGGLNLIFGVVEENLRLKTEGTVTLAPRGPAELGLSDTLALRTEIGSEKRARRIDWQPVLSGTVGLASTSRNDWLLIDTRATVEANRAAAAADAAAAQAAQAPPPSSPQAAPALPSLAAEEVERLLGQLKRFREQDLISEEVYQERVRQVLDRYLGPKH